VLGDMPPSSEELARVQPLYERLPGWKSSTFGISEYDKLPKAAREYLDYLTQAVGVEVGCISTGPERTQTIIRNGSRFSQLVG
jgi:adenylosuccinate synthase